MCGNPTCFQRLEINAISIALLLSVRRTCFPRVLRNPLSRQKAGKEQMFFLRVQKPRKNIGAKKAEREKRRRSPEPSGGISSGYSRNMRRIRARSDEGTAMNTNRGSLAKMHQISLPNGQVSIMSDRNTNVLSRMQYRNTC